LKRKSQVSPALVEQSALQLRRTRLSKSRATALAPEIARLNDAAMDAARDNDFNDEPSSFSIVLAQLKPRGGRP